jgi:CRISPR-associated protein Csy2
MSQFIILRKIQVQNANAISSPITYGLPAVTAFLGFAHALQRHFNTCFEAPSMEMLGVGIVSHRFELLDSLQGYNRFLRLTSNPLNEKGERPPFNEEGRCHMTVSLVLEVNGLNRGESDTELIQEIVSTRMKLAGGDIIGLQEVKRVASDQPFATSLMPGYALIERRSLMKQAMDEGSDALTALHRYLAVQNRSMVDEAGKITWNRRREKSGWIVPIATGFHAISPIQSPQNARDSSTPHRFAESVVTLGEFVLVSRFQSLAELLWRYDHKEDLYLCSQEVTS